MYKQKSKNICEEKIHQLKNMSVAFRKEEFLLAFNTPDEEENDENEEYMISIPAKVMNQIVEGLYSSGLKYQDNFGENIGFSERKV